LANDPLDEHINHENFRAGSNHSIIPKADVVRIRYVPRPDSYEDQRGRDH
jgi:hypothetical protein